MTKRMKLLQNVQLLFESCTCSLTGIATLQPDHVAVLNRFFSYEINRERFIENHKKEVK